MDGHISAPPPDDGRLKAPQSENETLQMTIDQLRLEHHHEKIAQKQLHEQAQRARDAEMQEMREKRREQDREQDPEKDREQDRRIAQLEEEMQEKDGRIAVLEQEMQEKDGRIAALEEHMRNVMTLLVRRKNR